jgi:hypothetical protein
MLCRFFRYSEASFDAFELWSQTLPIYRLADLHLLAAANFVGPSCGGNTVGRFAVKGRWLHRVGVGGLGSRWGGTR